jgi:hypothetical protein
MNINQAFNEVKLLHEVGQAPLLVSGSGMGKSQKAVAYAKEWVDEGTAKNIKRGFSITFLATHTPPDVVGYKFKGERDIIVDTDGDGKPITRKVTVDDASCPLWYISTGYGNKGQDGFPQPKPAFCYEEFMILFDEFGQAELDVKRAAAEIALSGGTPPYYAPNHRCLMLSNEGARYGVSKTFDFIIARQSRIEIKPDIDGVAPPCRQALQHRGKQWNVMGVTKAWARCQPHRGVRGRAASSRGRGATRASCLRADRFLQVAFANNRTSRGRQPDDGSARRHHRHGSDYFSYASHMQFLLRVAEL